MKKLSVFFLVAILATLFIVPASASAADVIYNDDGTYRLYPSDVNVPDFIPSSVVDSQSFLHFSVGNPETEDPDDWINYWFWGFSNAQLREGGVLRIYNNPSCMYAYAYSDYPVYSTPSRPPVEGLYSVFTLRDSSYLDVGEGTPFVNQTDTPVKRSWIAKNVNPSFVSVIGSLFRKLPALLLSAISIFYVGGRLTVLGWLAVPALAIAFAILVIKIVVRFMQFRG